MFTNIMQQSEQLEKPRRISNLALNCTIFILDCFVPTDIERGAITVPESIRNSIEKRGLRRISDYDQLRSPPSEQMTHLEEAVGVKETMLRGDEDKEVDDAADNPKSVKVTMISVEVTGRE